MSKMRHGHQTYLASQHVSRLELLQSPPDRAKWLGIAQTPNRFRDSHFYERLLASPSLAPQELSQRFKRALVAEHP